MKDIKAYLNYDAIPCEGFKYQVEIYEANTVDGKETQNKIDNRDNVMKKMLASKYEDLMGDD